MSDSRQPEELPLFRELSDPKTVAVVRSWRPTIADGWAERPPTPRAFNGHFADLLQRDLEFMEALQSSGVSDGSPHVQRFEALHAELARACVRCRDAPSADVGAADAGRLIPGMVAELASLRRRVLEELEPRQRGQTMACELAVRVPEREVDRVIAAAELEVAEERNDIVEVRSSASPEAIAAPGLGAIVDALLDFRRSEQEHRPLPARGRLATMLSRIPATWLDATWGALGLGPQRPKHRKERERRIAQQLTDAATLRDVVENKLSLDEQRLVAFLLRRRGPVAADVVTHLFGSDEEDGWFWAEEPPTSTLGRVRLHGLAFVGLDPAATERGPVVLVPAELREPLRALLDAHEGDDGTSLQGSDLSSEIVTALEQAFPDGVVELMADESLITEFREELCDALSALPRARLLYERPALLEPPVDAAYDRDDPEAWVGLVEEDRSYELFFLSPERDEFQFEIEGELMDENGRRYPTTGMGQIGYAIAVSTLAPIALLRITSLDTEENEEGEVWTQTPDIAPRYFDPAGEPESADAAFLDMLSDRGIEALHELREGIVRVLDGFGIVVLAEDEAKKLVPWLEVSDEVVLATDPGEPITVEDALFFRCP